MSLCSIVVLDFAPGTKASIYPGSNINRDKLEGSKTVSVVVLFERLGAIALGY